MLLGGVRKAFLRCFECCFASKMDLEVVNVVILELRDALKRDFETL